MVSLVTSETRSTPLTAGSDGSATTMTKTYDNGDVKIEK